ncbi:MAG: hypothetical protein Q7S32_03785 [bacterium]|nr:hypothetical protein [bacterium]
MRKIGKWVIPAATILLPFVAMAALTNPTATLTGKAITLTEIEDLITGAGRFLITISIIVAVIFIIYGGIRWITARDNDDAVASAKKIIMNGIIGAIIILGVGVILQTLAGVITRDFFGNYK